MPTSAPFSRVTSLQQLAPILDSIGAHLSAKLASFGSDERTLTDELCDMMCIWSTPTSNYPAQLQPPAYTALPPHKFTLTVTKTTTSQEVATGADVELTVGTPLGWKRALFQAKVLDPYKKTLRCDYPGGWIKLGKQLRKMRKEAPGCAHLLVYVPGGDLDGAAFGYSTWEQGFGPVPTSSRSSRFGATAINADDLLHPGGR
jgi:hypothetical protein